MNKNDISLVSHALKLYGVQYNDNIYSNNYNTKKYIEVGDCNIPDSYLLRVYRGTADISMYNSRNTSSNLDINIRSFINHWIQYFNFNKTIKRVAIGKCYHNRFDIKILCNDDCLYYVLSSPYRLVDDWIRYNW